MGADLGSYALPHLLEEPGEPGQVEEVGGEGKEGPPGPFLPVLEQEVEKIQRLLRRRKTLLSELERCVKRLYVTA